MKSIVIDYESFYDNDVSLSKLTTQEYITHPEFEVIGVGVQWADKAEPYWATDHHVDAVMNTIREDQDNTVLIAHNAAFDGAIASWHYGVRPAFLVDTISMARVLGLQSTVGGSLAKLAEQMIKAGVKVPNKGDEVIKALGKHRKDFTDADLRAYGAYCMDDCRIARTLYNELLKLMPVDELMWQSTVLKMYTEPMLRVNHNTVHSELQRVRERREAAKHRLAHALGVTDLNALVSVLNSNPKFAEALTLFGAEVPMKISDTTGKPTFALGIKDAEFLELQEHPVPEVRELVVARMGLKSSIEESRCEQFLKLAEFAAMPAPYKVSGARTHRLGGNDGNNLQNLPSGRIKGQSKALRESIEAPDGHVLVGADSSQIECLWGEGLVLTEYNGWVKIRDVSTSDRIWDGIEWVNHEGPIYKGKKNVITYSGITATPDHVVYLADGGSTSLVEARDGAKTILTYVNEWEGIWQVDSAEHTTAGTEQRFGSSPLRMQLWGNCMGERVRPKAGEVNSMLPLWQVEQKEVCPHTSTTGEAVAGTLQRNDRTCEGGQKIVEDLCRGGGSDDCGGVRQLHVDQLSNGRLHRVGGGSDTNQRPLRTGEHTTGHALAECADTDCKYHGDLQRRGVVSEGVCGQILPPRTPHVCADLVEERYVGGTMSCSDASNLGTQGSNERDIQRRDASSSNLRQEVLFTSELAGGVAVVESREDSAAVCGWCWPTTHEDQADVWDIVNAGPRNRFTYNGRIVSNCRVIDFIASNTPSLENFRNGVCPYSSVAVQLFNEGEPEQIKRDAKKGIEPWAMRRQIAKSARLALQFGQGGAGYQAYAKTQAGLTLTLDEAEHYKKAFRSANPAIVNMWRLGDKVLGAMLRGESGQFGGPDGKLFFYDGSRTVLGEHIPGVRLPDGVWVSYPKLELVEGKFGPSYRFCEMQGRKREYVYVHGSKFIQQLVQSTAFAAMKYYATVIDYKIVLNSHDEHVLCVPIAQADAAAAELESLMKTAPPWAPGLPLDCEVHRGFNYGELK